MRIRSIENEQRSSKFVGTAIVGFNLGVVLTSIGVAQHFHEEPNSEIAANLIGAVGVGGLVVGGISAAIAYMNRDIDHNPTSQTTS